MKKSLLLNKKRRPFAVERTIESIIGNFFTYFMWCWKLVDRPLCWRSAASL